jgi:hypothetical protein
MVSIQYAYTMTKKVENNYAFIDSQNLYLAIKSFGWAVDWAKFRVYFKGYYKEKNAYLFIGYSNFRNKIGKK